ELRADRAGRGGRARGRDDRRHDEPPLDDGETREPSLRAESVRAARPDGEGRGAQPRLGRRGARGRLRDTKGACVILASQSPSLIVFEVTILVLAIFLGVEVISKVPTMLHTSLMSGTNAIHGIVIVGAIL